MSPKPVVARDLGVAKMPPGGTLGEHRHRQAEVYLVLSGSGCVRVDGEEAPIEAGSAVFIPGDAAHSCENTGASELRVAYVLAADSFEDVDYVFED
ncbi:cupin domain-containing protein [Rubrobacter tropicus]|uniref:Cupin domain-containing protein n=1 Tax=Rubrobacter tropicus TaxID=2653851 RepID=A0A6G8QAE4_9ACTN|nr:cupin domain-containing protein [Rubrobacter tropicus]QIN83464.1 cupin domain-containing protein [Rubrobacter tropicus]